MSKLLKITDMETSKEIILSLEQLLQMKNLKEENTKQFQSIFSHLRKNQKEKKEESEKLARKNKIKKNKKKDKRKNDKSLSHSFPKLQMEGNDSILQYLRCDEDINQNIFSSELFKKREYFDQNQRQILQDFITDLVEDICYENDRRKSLLQLEPKDFLNILVTIDRQYGNFIERIRELQDEIGMDFREKKLNEADLEAFFINQILLNIPEIKEVLQNFEEKYSHNQEYKNQYRQLLTGKRIIFSIKRIIEKQNESDEDNYCCNLEICNRNEQISHTEEIFSILNKDHLLADSKDYNWEDMKIRLNEFSMKIQEQMNSKNKKKKKKKQKQKERKNMLMQSSESDNKQDQCQKKTQELCDYLQNLQIDPMKTSQCRLDEEWIEKFKKKHFPLNKLVKKSKFKFTQKASKQTFDKCD